MKDPRDWIEARKRHRLTDAEVQMARELGMNPKKLGKLDNHKQERWKMPLKEFIAHLYFKRFGRRMPERVVSIKPKEQAKKAAAPVERAPATRYDEPMKPQTGWENARENWARMAQANERARREHLRGLTLEGALREFEQLCEEIHREFGSPMNNLSHPVGLIKYWKIS